MIGWFRISFYLIFVHFFTPTLSALVHFLQPGDEYTYLPKKGSDLYIFCYEGRPKNVIHVWQSVVLNVNHSTTNYVMYYGTTPDEVNSDFLLKRNSWYLNFFSNKHVTMKLDPFNSSCIGIDSLNEYSIKLNVIKIDLWKLMYLAIGIILFISADKLSNNTFFYYGCGICFGVCASFLILIYFASRIIPRKPFMYGVLGCGWTIVLYLLQMLWENLSMILLNYKVYIIWYTIGSAFISFLVCYRRGPINNERTKQIIKWTLQLLSLISIYFSSGYKEAAVGQIVLLLFFYNLPKKWLLAPKSYWKKKFPPKLKLLTNDEYYEQGVRETTKALEQLREYCSSPECNQWKTALKLKDVKRFASFIEGNSHLSDSEILEYETSMREEIITDEENSDDESEF